MATITLTGTSIYDTLVRMAGLQHALRSGRRQGNFDRSTASACGNARTEARLEAIAEALMADPTRRPSTSSRTTTRPPRNPVLPAAYPNLLVNGSSGTPSAWRPTSRRTCGGDRRPITVIEHRSNERGAFLRPDENDLRTGLSIGRFSSLGAKDLQRLQTGRGASPFEPKPRPRTTRKAIASRSS
jgi:hypothetical protein